MPKKTISVKSWTRFKVQGLSIVASLCGKSHKFNFNNYDIEVFLPKKPKETVYKKDELISCIVWKLSGKKKIPKQYGVYSIDVYVNLPKKFSIPEDSIGKIDSSKFSKTQQEMLKKTVSKHEEISNDAFDYWLRILRWKTQKGFIGQPQIKGNESGWSTYLLEASTNKRFYAGTHAINVMMDKPVPKRTWNIVQNALTQETRSPIWFDFLFEGEQHLRTNNLYGAVLSLAISCETIIRGLISLHAKIPVNKEFLTLLNKISVTPIIDRWEKLNIKGKSWEKIMDKKCIKALFDCRNRIVHRGSVQDLTYQECKTYAIATRSLILNGEKLLS